MQYEAVITRDFHREVAQLSADVANRANNAADRMLDNPWAAELHPEQVRAAEPGVHSCRVDRNYRIIWKYIKPKKIVFLLVDKHEEAYRRAARKTFTIDESNCVVVRDILEVGAKPAEALFGAKMERAGGRQIGKLFVGYSDKEICEWGVPEALFENIRSTDNLNELGIFQGSTEMPAEVFDKLLEVAIGEVQRPVVPDHKLEESIDKNQGGEDLYQFLDSEEFKRVLQGNMEEWMLFLAPFQRAITIREYTGPGRVRGVAGSGKTVVALHRARHLVRKLKGSDKKVLFLTYGNRLPNVMGHLYERLAGAESAELDAIEFSTIHQLCTHLMRQAGVELKVKTDLLEGFISDAIQRIKNSGNTSKLLDRSIKFFQDEIRFTIKGRRVQTIEQYLALNRTGRGSALGESERKTMFAVFQQYQSLLRLSGLSDFDDFILTTIRLIEDGEIGELPYAHVIVDEIQDLTEATIKLVRLLVLDGKNDLFLVGDGLQRIYPGGYSLANLGIDVGGARSSLLKKNYRNTQQILQAAYAMMRELRYDDMEPEESQSVEPEYSVRQGSKPMLRGFSIAEAEVKWVKEQIGCLQQQYHYKPGDFGILFRWSRPYKEILERVFPGELMEVGQDASSFFGDKIKYTTFHSAKGLEFKVVFVVGVTDGQLVPKDDWSLEGDELREYLATEKRLLYVAMTRGRDLLYIGYSRGQASRFLVTVPVGYWESVRR